MTVDSPISVRSPAELVAVVPYLLGFHPADSVVLVGLAAQAVGFCARYDLPPPECAEEDAEEAAALIAQAIGRQSAARVMIIGYGPAERVTAVVTQLAVAVRGAGLRIEDVLRVTDGRWWSYVCEDPLCCPAEGRPCLPADSVIAAEATLRGQVALPSRRDLQAQVAAVTGDERAAMVAATERARRRFDRLLAADDGRTGRYVRQIRQAGRAAVREAEHRYRTGGSLTEDEIAWLGMLLVDSDVADYAMDRRGRQDWRIRLWTDVLRRVEPVYVPTPACLLGFTAWLVGHGALARVAVDRALQAQPPHHLAGLMDNVLGYALPPQAAEAVFGRRGGRSRSGIRRRGR